VKYGGEYLVKFFPLPRTQAPEVGSVRGLYRQFFTGKQLVGYFKGLRTGKAYYANGTPPGRSGKCNNGIGKVKTHKSLFRRPYRAAKLALICLSRRKNVI
jgi:hypothetical protein